MMNKFLVLIAFLITCTVSCPVLAMQEPTSTETITYSNPFFTNNHIKICALANGIKVGSVKYKKEEQGYWYLAKLSVEPNYRNKPTLKIGFQLFSKCIAHISSKNPHRVHWFVTCIKDDSPNLQTLIAIYQKMVAHLNFSKNLTLEKYDTSAFMAITFNTPKHS